ncbi:MAG: flagellar hook capping protein [Lachnospiraceae bacterium]|jgi:flagellar basal-body rod modification protein FlgD|nr:flagellar hook capping protein [Lachnospiraceae bacterium]
MAEIFAPIEDGKFVDPTATNTQSKEKEKKANDGLDKDAFLQLLVAEMQYQDPLEPTTNTEYISQFATFSQLEATQNVELSNKIAMANDLVGKQVIMKSTTDGGATAYHDGQVDYAFVENGKVYLSLGGDLYNIDDLDTVIDPNYLDAVNLSKAFVDMINRIPSAQNITEDKAPQVAQAREVYDSLTDYQKRFVAADAVKKLTEVEEALSKMQSKE